MRGTSCGQKQIDRGVGSSKGSEENLEYKTRSPSPTWEYVLTTEDNMKLPRVPGGEDGLSTSHQIPNTPSVKDPILGWEYHSVVHTCLGYIDRV